MISGDVQGVFFRATAEEVARRHGVRGWIRNNQDGTVEAVAEGEEASVNEFVVWCRKGPRAAHVVSVEVRWEDYRDEFDGFSAHTSYSSY
jgi:acylphosphatase